MTAPVDPSPRPEGHRALVWLGLAGAGGLALGLLLLLALGEPDHGDGLMQRSATSASTATVGAESPSDVGWFDLELPSGERRRVRPEAALPTLLALKDDLDREPADARLDLDRRAIITEQPGRELDIDATLEAMQTALLAGGTRAPLVFEAVAPHRRASELRDVAFDVVLGAFETPYVEAGPESILRRLARALDGRVLLPGESFGFNALVGPRDDTHGYSIAAAVNAGELVDGVGSSASQSASTLYAAAIFAALEVLERHPHRGPTPVVELGLEAAVAFPALDLRLRNPYDFPIVLREIVADGRLRAEVRGLRHPFSITLIRKIERATPFARIERTDASLPAGTRTVAQRGVPGFELRWHRIRREGSHAVRQTSDEHYPPTPQIVLVGTGLGSTTGRPQREPALQALPDELLVMTQDDARDGSLTVQRVPGRVARLAQMPTADAPAWPPPDKTVVAPVPTSPIRDFFGR